MKRVIAYIDGYNLYYGLLKGTPYKWLDLVAFVKWFLRPDQKVVGIKYFTAPIKTYPHDADAVDRQKVYLQALSAMPLITIVQGFYAKNKTLAPVVEHRCRTCDVVINGYVPVVKLEEKRSDVNFSVAVMLDAFQNMADSFFLFTGDTDQVGTIEAVRDKLGKRVCVFNPHESFSVNLKMTASYYQNTPRPSGAMPTARHNPLRKARRPLHPLPARMAVGPPTFGVAGFHARKSPAGLRARNMGGPRSVAARPCG